MPSGAPYTPAFDFPSDPAPLRPVNDVALQAELRSIANTFAQLYAALERVIRDDDTLTDQLVRLRNLHPELSTWLLSHITGTVATESIRYTYPVRVVATTNLPALSGPATIDSVAVTTGDRVLITGQTIASQNGIYLVDTTSLWSRAPDLPHGVTADPAFGVIVSEGAVYHDTAWRLSPVYVTGQTLYTVGVDSVRFVQVFGPFPLPVSRGGTGASTAAGARQNLLAATYFVHDVTITAPNTYMISVAVTSPNADCRQAVIQVYEVQGSQTQLTTVDVVAQSHTVHITFSSPPPVGTTYRVVVVGA